MSTFENGLLRAFRIVQVSSLTSPRALGYQFSPRSIFRRCVQCPATMPPCPVCAEDETCTMTSRSCDTCGTMTCVKISTVSGSTPTPTPQSGGTNAGAIAGGVIGGVAFIGIVTFLVWWFFVRKKRKEYAQQLEYEKSEARQASQSRKSVASIASTVLTRASNVIQIAYIPGVTNRSPPDTPGTLVPPVPPLPGASPDQHFFLPGDLRDSAWSGVSDRISLAPSLARSSVATAIVSPVPAQQAMRGKAAMVSVRSAPNTPNAAKTTAPDAPAVPPITQSQLDKAGIPNSSIVARTVTAKPVSVHFKKKNKEPTASDFPAAPSAAKTRDRPASQAESTASHSRTRRLENEGSGFDSSSDEEGDPHERSRRSLHASGTDNVTEDSPADMQSPFADTQATKEDSGTSSGVSARNSVDGKRTSTHRHRNSQGSNRLLEEAVTNAARLSGHQKRGSTASSPRGVSPFDDSNEVKP